MSAFRHIPSKRTKTVAWITQMATEVPDLLREAKIFKGTFVPSNSIMKVKFKEDIELEIKEKSVI